MAECKEFLIAVDKADGEDRAEYCVLSVNVDALRSRQAALVAAMAADGGVQHIAYSNLFRAEFFDANFPVSGADEDCPFSSEAQDEFDGEHVTEIPEGLQESLLEDFRYEDNHNETPVEDDRLIVSSLGVMAYSTLDDGATPIRSWTVTWDKLGLPYPKVS